MNILPKEFLSEAEIELIDQFLKDYENENNNEFKDASEYILFKIQDYAMQPFSEYKNMAIQIVEKLKLIEANADSENKYRELNLRKDVRKIKCNKCNTEHAEIELDGIVKIKFICICGCENSLIIVK